MSQDQDRLWRIVLDLHEEREKLLAEALRLTKLLLVVHCFLLLALILGFVPLYHLLRAQPECDESAYRGDQNHGESQDKIKQPQFGANEFSKANARAKSDHCDAGDYQPGGDCVVNLWSRDGQAYTGAATFAQRAMP